MGMSLAKDRIFQFIKTNGPVDFVAILAATDYTPGTITGALAVLLESELIEEVEKEGVATVQVLAVELDDKLER